MRLMMLCSIPGLLALTAIFGAGCAAGDGETSSSQNASLRKDSTSAKSNEGAPIAQIYYPPVDCVMAPCEPCPPGEHEAPDPNCVDGAASVMPGQSDSIIAPPPECPMVCVPDDGPCPPGEHEAPDPNCVDGATSFMPGESDSIIAPPEECPMVCVEDEPVGPCPPGEIEYCCDCDIPCVCVPIM